MPAITPQRGGRLLPSGNPVTQLPHYPDYCVRLTRRSVSPTPDRASPFLFGKWRRHMQFKLLPGSDFTKLNLVRPPNDLTFAVGQHVQVMIGTTECVVTAVSDNGYVVEPIPGTTDSQIAQNIDVVLAGHTMPDPDPAIAPPGGVQAPQGAP